MEGVNGQISGIFDRDRILLFDGAMGTMLHRYGIRQGELPEGYNMEHPDIIARIHAEYLDAGADVVSANTFGANRFKLEDSGYSVQQIVKAAVTIARNEADKDGRGGLVALDVGPTGRMMQPIGTLTFDEAYDVFKEQVAAGAAAGADLVLIETMSDIYEVKAAVLAAKENCSLPVLCTMTLQKDGRTLTGTDTLTMVNILEGLGIDALGINCSLGPNEMLPHVERILKYASVPVIIQPNAGLPKIIDGETVFDITREEFAGYCKQMAELGASILGGCCGTDPSFIKALKDSCKDLKPVRRTVEKITAVSSGSKTVVLGEGVRIIGERINPTGKKKLKEALKSGDMEYVLREAVNQLDAGADILDVNVGLPELDEATVMVDVMQELQSVVNLPLQIDSASAVVIEAAVRKYNGKALINSVNGKEEIMHSIFPIARKYGACIVGLTLDETGIPSKAEDRVRIADKIIRTAEEYGLHRNDIIIDCLVLTASAQQEEVKETIRALRMVKEQFGVKTTLGVSNVSFGLPQRETINRTFLATALGAGLDAPILNPLSSAMMDTVAAFNVLWNYDRDAKNFIELQGTVNEKSAERQGQQGTVNENMQTSDLEQAILKGLKNEAGNITSRLIKEMKGMEIVDKYLVPSLDIVGKDFEAGKIFLPQLIQSAEAVKKAFEVIKEDMMTREDEKIHKGKIIMATVKGDVHDIGKNIVKILLQNYGYEVIDLGKDVHENVILEQALKHNVKLIGLSALMTTTVKSMEEAVRLLKSNIPDCKIMVGGAVLTDEYAEMIGADFYAKDANAAVKISQAFFVK